ncbi:MAG: polymerase sigma factor [Paenibacillus sp.]|nr:polymerase sigma factor [Paenibacillus sp.]
MESHNEQLLLEAIRNGDKRAFQDLVHPMIGCAYQTSYMIVRSPHLAEEAVQNSMIELYKTIMAGKEIRHVRGWFNRLLAHRSLDLIRQENRHRGLNIDDMVIEDKSASPAEELLRKEQTDQLLEAVLSLDEQQRAIVVLYYFQEMKIEEIASTLHMNAATVKTRLHRARAYLGRLLPYTRLSEKVVHL